MNKVRIGGGQGFWGDSNDAAIHMMKTKSAFSLRHSKTGSCP